MARAPVRHTPSGIGRSFQPRHAHNDDRCGETIPRKVHPTVELPLQQPTTRDRVIGSSRSDDLLRQAQDLKARSEDVASATAQLLRKLEDLPVDQRASVLQALGAHPDTQQVLLLCLNPVTMQI